jgi:AAA+ ATPase superfamily predicted ATPase
MLKRFIITSIIFLGLTLSSYADAKDRFSGEETWVTFIKSNDGKKEIQSFMDNVLQQFDSEIYLNFINEIPQDIVSSEQTYNYLQNRFQNNRSFLHPLKKINALRFQQQERLILRA